MDNLVHKKYNQKHEFYFQSDQSNFSGINEVPSTARCNFVLSKPLVLPSREYQFVMYVNRVNIPYCFQQYNTPYGTNIQSFQLYNATTAVGFYASSIVIPDGNYTPVELISVMIPLLQTNILGGTTLSSTINFVYDTTTNRIGIKINPASLVGGVDDWYLYLLPDRIALSLGIAEQDDFVSNDTFFTFGLKTSNTNWMQNIYVIATLSDNEAYAAKSQRARSSNVVAVVPINVAPNNFIQYEFYHPILVDLDMDTISSIEFDVTDYLEQPVVQFDQPWSFHVSIHQLYIPRVNYPVIPSLPMPPSITFPENPNRVIIDTNVEDSNQNLLEITDRLKDEVLNIQRNAKKRKNNDQTANPTDVSQITDNTKNTTSNDKPADRSPTEDPKQKPSNSSTDN